MKKTVIAFDLDDTLAVSKSPITDRMGELLVKLLNKYEVAIISGGKFELFKTQVVDRLGAAPKQLTHLHLMPTCSTKYYRYNDKKDEWVRQYSNDLTEGEKRRIIKVLELSAKDLGLWEEKPYGSIIEDRDSQITYSALGQEAPSDKKYKWAEKNAEIRKELRTAIAEQLPDLEVRSSGTTSVDVTHIGIDKAYGMEKLITELGIKKDDVLFIGDKLQEGGNDYPVKAIGIDTIEVNGWEDTAFVLEGILAVS